MKRSLLCLLAAALLLPLQAQVGYLLPASSISDLPTENGQKPEQNAAQWFQTQYVTPGKGRMISLSEAAAGIDTATIKVLWVNVDRVGLASLDAAGINSSVISAIRQFVEKGGKLLLTKQATTIAHSIGRMGYAPGFGNGNYSKGNDVWTINPHLGIDPAIGHVYDRANHPIYTNVPWSTNINSYTYGGVTNYYSTLPLVGAVPRTDNNCIWTELYRRDPNTGGAMAEGPNTHYQNNNHLRLEEFEADWNCQMLAAWGQVLDFCSAGIVDFNPHGNYRGRVLAIGFAAYQWGSSNDYINNIKQLTGNALAYLSGETPAPGPEPEPIEEDVVLYLPMEMNDNGQVTELVHNNRYSVQGKYPASVRGAVGKAVRMDGYSSYVDVPMNGLTLSNQKQTISLWCATQTYPMMQMDAAADLEGAIISCLDDNARTGFAFSLYSQGRYGFVCYVNGNKITCYASGKLPKYQWTLLTATIDATAGQVRLYCNGTQVASASCGGNISLPTASLIVGKSRSDVRADQFYLNTYNGIIDEVKIYNRILTAEEISAVEVPSTLDLNTPASVFEYDVLRPRHHAMPASNWMNESHGLTYSNGRYHLFFQKNGNGPYMSRLHWGHVSSENLYDWHEEKIAIAPDKSYDMKGCWSGCVFSDAVITGGEPYIIYTGVDNARATINMAAPKDNDLQDWEKRGTIINGTPGGQGYEDFRDPYFFRNGDNAYIIVGTGKNGVSTTTLHRYNASSKTWTSDASTFFTGTNAAQCGFFFEMPNITNMGGGKWIFTATPLGSNSGVRTIYYTGTIQANGQFSTSFAAPKTVELSGYAREGYGLLSPSIYQHNGKTIAMGIVPDKLPGSVNYDMGYAHTISFPREWSIDAQGELIQKPYEGLQELRSDNSLSRTNWNLNGRESLAPVEGREIELEATFTVGPHDFGFNILETGGGQCKVYYSPGSNQFVVDFTSLSRHVNDGGVFGGVYRSSLPAAIAQGSTMKIHLFFDHSILDVFINDRWASSIRIFATSPDANGVSIFANGSTQVQAVNAWVMKENQGDITTDMDYYTEEGQHAPFYLDGTYNVLGQRVSNPLPGHIYIHNGKKTLMHH